MPTPLTTHFSADTAQPLPLPPELASLYGALAFPEVADRPYVISNFVTTLDGVVSWNVPGQAGGGEISGFNETDVAVMGLLRAASAAVIIGAATLRVVPDHLWTSAFICPALGPAYQALRASLHMPRPPLAVIVTGSGEVDLGWRLFTSGEEPALIVTTPDGERRLRARGVPAGVAVAGVAAGADGRLSAPGILAAVQEHLPGAPQRLLVEGGPQLMASYFEAQALDELFLTLAPQVAGRDPSLGAAGWRPGLVEGALLAPERPAWGRLVSVKQSASHIFLRYRFRV